MKIKIVPDTTESFIFGKLCCTVLEGLIHAGSVRFEKRKTIFFLHTINYCPFCGEKIEIEL